MDKQTEEAFTWLRQIPGELFKLDEKPLLGYPPPFAWSTFASQFGAVFQIEGLSIQPGEWQWRSNDDLFSGLGNELKGLPLNIVPLTGLIWWVIPKNEMLQLIQIILAKQTTIPKDGIDEDFLDTFYRFLALEAISAFEKVNADKKLSPTLVKGEELPSGNCLTLDLTIKADQHHFHGRLFLSSEFRKAWMQRYLQEQASLLSSPMAEKLDVIIHLEAGRVSLLPSEWKEVHPGDMILLDQCSLSPDEDKGRVMLVINEVPYFRAKIKQGSLKILEHPLYHEVDIAMPTPPNDKPPKTPQGDDLEDEDFDFEEDEDLHEDEEEEFDFDAEIEESEIEKKEPSKEPAAPKAPPTPPLPASEPGPKLSVEEIPLPVVVEVGRIQMSIKKLLELQPGNMLDLDIHPEAGVDLVVHGKRIARGELLRIGDVLGIRITELS